MVIFKSFNRKEEYFFVFEWLFYTFQNVKKWQNNPFSGGSKYIKVSQITIFQNLCTKFRVKTQWWELFLFQLFNIKVLSEDFNFQKTQNIYFWRGALSTPKMENEVIFSHFCINFIITIRKLPKNYPFFQFLKAKLPISCRSLLPYKSWDIQWRLLVGTWKHNKYALLPLKSLLLIQRMHKIHFLLTGDI